ncbi:MAG: SIS domain-containing protein [Rhodospirillaceae bacterium]|jgi:D-sedoheptulose 7-phosphate isomerase|nr:SIS domain-containing protein [Rhodospirillaceae bacterium]MBT5242942.1 SIS domain-containing protein [Rhodospirillaceae bacterium]MBT5563166.1 SIS domain-containing protein [Rhodospirillaceae bacterium]MBT6243481.1 SIS domain-containing protein [Rhodospirillaceae bacterium]MBT7137548.1 SIS domain-containing protein [Rhodospirillaceae bacterium]
MTFPDEKYEDIGAFSDAYFEQISSAAASVDRVTLVQAADVIEQTYRENKTLFVCGNGGSAAISGTFVCDHSKLVQTDTNLTARVVSLADNMSMITAIANDLSYDDIFQYQLQTLANFGDTLLTISASGDSENVVKAASWARENKMPVIAFTGFEGGRMADLASVHLHVQADNYGVIEDVHQSLMHLLAQFIRQKQMSAGLIANRKF